MKTNLTLIFALIFGATFAQEAAPDITETDCGDNTESVSEAISDGKPLLVIASGYDCGICVGEAPGFGDMADSLVGVARVWGAMHHRFSNTTPNCTQLENWKNNYGWENFFMFNDVNNGSIKNWAQGGYTSYTVIDTEMNYVYKGTNRNTALTSFFELVEETVTSVVAEEFEQNYFYQEQSLLKIHLESDVQGRLQVATGTGEVVFEEEMNLTNGQTLPVYLESNKMLFLNFVSENGQVINQKILKI
jgi:hypothetical protein